MAGIDQALVHLLDGVDDLEGLENHAAELKARFYSEENLAKAQIRGTARPSNGRIAMAA
jgi:hypothetical protein